MKKRYKAIIEYCGTQYSGFQKQNNLRTIEGCINEALRQLYKKNIEIYGCGRTDAGVHALGQVIHFEAENKFQPYQIISALNYFLRNEDITIVKIISVTNNFHARYSAKRRYYKYLILNRPSNSPILDKRVWHVKYPLDLEKIKLASIKLIGKHDFTSFRSTECGAKDPVKNISHIRISKKNDMIKIAIDAPSFLHNQVRIIVGTLIDIGSGKIDPQKMEEIVNAKDRKKAGQTAPAYGLYFVKASY